MITLFTLFNMETVLKYQTIDRWSMVAKNSLLFCCNINIIISLDIIEKGLHQAYYTCIMNILCLGDQGIFLEQISH